MGRVRRPEHPSRRAKIAASMGGRGDPFEAEWDVAGGARSAAEGKGFRVGGKRGGGRAAQAVDLTQADQGHKGELPVAHLPECGQAVIEKGACCPVIAEFEARETALHRAIAAKNRSPNCSNRPTASRARVPAVLASPIWAAQMPWQTNANASHHGSATCRATGRHSAKISSTLAAS